MNIIYLDGNNITKVVFSKYDEFSYLITIKAFKKETNKIISAIDSIGFGSIIEFSLVNFPSTSIIQEFLNKYYIYAGEFKYTMADRGTSGAGARAGTTASHDVIELYCLKVDENRINEMRQSFIKNYMTPFLNFFYHKFKYAKTLSDDNYIISNSNFFINKLLNCEIKNIEDEDSNIIEINDFISQVII